MQFTANNERAVQTLKPSAQKNEFLVIFCKFAHCFSSALRYAFHRACPSSVSNCYRCTAAYSAIQLTVL